MRKLRDILGKFCKSRLRHNNNNKHLLDPICGQSYKCSKAVNCDSRVVKSRKLPSILWLQSRKYDRKVLIKLATGYQRHLRYKQLTL